MKKRKISVLIAGLFLSISTLGSVSCGKKADDIPSTPDVPVEPDKPEHVHTPSEWKSDETSHWHTCSGCDEILDKANHTFSDWVETKPATCTEKGERIKTCTVCNYVFKEEIPILGHKPKVTFDSDDTHHWHTCETCGEILDKTPHTFGDWVITKPATCTEKGEKTKTCTVCNHVIKEEIPVLGHKPTATFESDDTHHWHTCETCGEILDKTPHTFGDWVITKPATCTEKGERTKTCSVCNHVIKEEIPVLGHKPKVTFDSDDTYHWHTCETCGEILDKTPHTFGDWVITKPATCTEKGEKTKTCSVCNHVIKEEIPVLGHKPKVTFDSDDTYHWHTCETCGEILDKTPHTLGDWVVVEEPTCSKTGKKIKTCSVCNHVIEEEIPINPQKHEFGSFELVKEPTIAEEGKITITCKHNVEHTQEVILPKLDSNIYQQRQVDKDNHTYDSFYCFDLNNQEGINALFAGTLMEGTKQLNTFISESTFAHKDICKHLEFVAEYISYPTNSTAGKMKVYCPHCNESEIITIPVSSLKNYNCIASETKNGQAKYSLNLEACNDLFESTNLKTKFPDFKQKIAESIKKAEFEAPLYNLHIESVTSLNDPTQPIILKVFIPRDVNLPQYIEVNTHLVWRSFEWLNFVYEPGANCNEPIKKSAYFKEDMAVQLAQKYLDPECGIISTHPNIVSELTSICLGNDMEVTQEEQTQYSKHELGKVELYEEPSSWGEGKGGILRIYCANKAKCNYHYDLKIPKFDDANFYETTGSITVSHHKVKDSAINTTINDALKDKFIFTMDEQTRQKFRDVLEFTIHKGIAVSNARPISDTSDGFALALHVDGRHYKTVEANFTRFDTQYFNVSYYETKCNNFKKQYFLNEAGVNKFMSTLEPELQENEYLRSILMGNWRVGMATPSDAEIAANKTINHQFVYYYHNIPTGTTERNGNLCVRCTSCGKAFKVDISFNDIYTFEGGQQIINQEGLENRIKETFPAFSLEEVRAFAEIFITGNYLLNAVL